MLLLLLIKEVSSDVLFAQPAFESPCNKLKSFCVDYDTKKHSLNGTGWNETLSEINLITKKY
jgi:hypothetical protein